MNEAIVILGVVIVGLLYFSWTVPRDVRQDLYPQSEPPPQKETVRESLAPLPKPSAPTASDKSGPLPDAVWFNSNHEHRSEPEHD